MAVHIIMSILPKNQLSFGAWSTSSWFGILFCCCWCWRTTRVIDRLTVDGLWLLEVSLYSTWINQLTVDKNLDPSNNTSVVLSKLFLFPSDGLIVCLFVIASDWWRRRWFGFRPNKYITPYLDVACLSWWSRRNEIMKRVLHWMKSYLLAWWMVYVCMLK